MTSLIERDASNETWHVIPKHDATLRDIYDRLSAGKLTGREVRVEVQKALGRESTEATKKPATVQQTPPKAAPVQPISNPKATVAQPQPAKQELVFAKGKEAAVAVGKIADGTSERAEMWKQIGHVIGKDDVEALLKGLAESIKGDATRKRVWLAIRDTMQAESEALKQQPVVKSGKQAAAA